MIACSALLLLFLLCGCQLEPPYSDPHIHVPSKWKYPQPNPNDTHTSCIENWWEIFQDPVLNELEKQVIGNNLDLQAALERVKEARDLAGIVKSKLFPQLDLVPYHMNQGILIEQYSVTGNHFLRAHERTYALPLKLSYEVDLWCKNWNEYKSAFFSAEARAWDYQTILLILTTDLATAYFQLRTQDTLIDLYKTTLATRKKALSINQSRFRNEINNYNPVALSELDLSNVESQYEDAIRLRALFENQIAVLIASAASEFTLKHAPLHEMPPVIPSGTPSDIIRRRPDLAEQEQIMISIHAQIGVAYASFFPSVELVGEVGFLSPNFRDFLSFWSRLWMYGVNISQYVFDAGARCFNVKMTWAQYRESVNIYKQKILVAFREVEDALSNLKQISEEMQSVQNSVKAAQKAYSIAYHRYIEGADFYLAVADDERQVLDNQRAYMSLLGLYYLNTIQLIKALGGGWQ
jgi:outer membrane protein, multidrug efflux system